MSDEGDISEEEARRIEEQLDREEEQDRRIRREWLRRRYRQSIPVVAGIFFTAAVLWALTGAILPFLKSSVFQESHAFTDLVQKINFAAQSVSYAGVFTLGGTLIVTHLTRRTQL